MELSINRGEMGDLSGWPSAIHAEVSDYRLPPRMIVARWRCRLDQRTRSALRRSRRGHGLQPERAALPLVSLPVILASLAIRHRLRAL
ncbi:MAG: hypothetical protein M3440_16255 [Chloroflexota bacterium]|nr:hypothetical protein [Chloroflexota bacterium]